MLKIVESWRAFWVVFWAWYAFFWAGPGAFVDQVAAGTHISELMVERACRRVIDAQHARVQASRDLNPATVRLMDADERTVVVEQTIPNFSRRPQIHYQGRTFTASRRDGDVWIYRRLA